ncbi:MAG: hypothetical protein AB7O52_09410 [Planctomycetota bacterium]
MPTPDRGTIHRFVAPPAASGMALILVILVLSALVLIGTPFILSMTLQEQGSVHTAAQERARLGAESARNYAVAQLFATHPSRETGLERRELTPAGEGRAAAAPSSGVQTIEFPKTKVDGVDELRVLLPTEIAIERVGGESENTSAASASATASSFVLQSPTDQLLAVEIEDEQGKINLNTVPPIVLGNLLGGTQLAENVTFDVTQTEIAVVDPSVFRSDGDPDTVDGVVVIMNPLIFTMEAVSYRHRTETHLTGCFRGEYLSVPQEHREGWPIFDLRAFKVFLHRYYNLDTGELRTYRTPQAMREIAEWSIVPYFLKNLAALGLNLRNIDDFGLTTEMLLRAGLDEMLLEREEAEYDEGAYREAMRKLKQAGVPDELADLLERARGKAAMIEAADLVEKLNLGKLEMGMVGAAFEGEFKKQLKRLQANTKTYFPKGIEAYKEIFDQPGLETFTARDFEEIRDLVTVTSGVQASWSDEQSVIGEISTNSLIGFPSLQVANYSWFNPGTLIRIRSLEDPKKVEYHLAMGAIPIPRGSGPAARLRGSVFSGGIILKEALRFEYKDREAVVAALLRNPVNINTASRRVIEAVLAGLSQIDMRGGVRNVVNTLEARKLTERIIDERPILGFAHLKQIVEQASAAEELDSADVGLILMNAQNPNHRSLSVSSVGFCYASGDVYSIETTASINGPAGMEIASHRIREVIEVAPPDPLGVELSSQSDFMVAQFPRAEPMRDRWPLTATWLPGREGNLMITQPVPLHQRNWESPSETSGSIKALTTELGSVNETFGYGSIEFAPVEHFPDTIEGWDTANGPHTMSTVADGAANPAPGGSGGAPAPAVSPVDPDQSIVFSPSAIEFWVRPNWDSRSGDRTFFDTIADPSRPERNRIRCYFDGADQAIVLQVMDDAAPPRSPEANGPTVIPNTVPITGGGEIRYRVTPATFANDTWYHLTAAWGSSRPGDQLLMIDRRPVGEHKWATRLAGALAINGRNVSLEQTETAGFPETWPKKGSLLVGTEVIDYEGSKIIQRGARGTVRQNHPRGTPVRLFGYGVEVVPSDPRLPLDTAQNVILVPKGGAKLAKALPISRDSDMLPASFATMRGLDFPGPYNQSTTVIRVQGDPGAQGFPAQGYLFVYPIMSDATGFYFNTGVWEYVKYAGVRPGAGGAGATAEFYNLTHDPVGANKVDTTQLSGQLAFLVVVSVGIETDVDNLSELYPPSGVIQLDTGTGNTTTGANAVEWIYYWMIAENKYFLGRPLLRGYGFRGFTGNMTYSDDLLINGELIFDTTTISDHPVGQPVVPVMRVTRPFLAEDDWVSVGDSYGTPAERKSEGQLMRLRIVRETDLGTFFSFAKQPLESYVAGGVPKLKKFPSGELPSVTSQQISFGAAPAPGLTGAGPLGAVIDEIRLSRLSRSDFVATAFPVSPGGRMVLDEVPPPPGQSRSVERRAIRTWFDSSAEVGRSGQLDRIRFVGSSKLVPLVGAGGAIAGLAYQPAELRGFGLGKPEGLFAIDQEVFHYSYDETEGVAPAATALLAQTLPRDAVLWSAEVLQPGENRLIDPARDLRSEVIPEIAITPETGELPATDGFLEFVNDARKEIIYYERRSGGRLYNCLRGQLGTEVGTYVYQYQYYGRQGQLVTQTNEWRLRVLDTREIDVLRRSMLNTERLAGALGEAALLPLPQIAVTRTAGPITTESLPVVDARLFERRLGYAILDDGDPNTTDEIIGYQQREGNELLLLGRDDRTGNGIFRGRFGTPKRGVTGQDVPVVSFPARYHDRFDAQVESADLMYWQRAFQTPGARWDRIVWQVEEQRNTTFDNEVWVLVRFDGAPDWDQQPTNRPGGLYLFKDGGAVNRLGVQADLAEVRVMFRYPDGSYGRNSAAAGAGWSDTWKHSPVLDSLRIEYRKEARAIHRENLPF